MFTLRFWKAMDNNRIETPAVVFTAVRQQGNMLYATHPEKGEAAVAEAAKGLEPFKVTWLPMAPHFTSDRMLYYHGFEIKSLEPAPVPVPVPIAPIDRLTFGDLRRGDKFIAWPLDGDNNGYEGYRGAAYSAHLFVVTLEARPTRGNSDYIQGLAVNIRTGVESAFRAAMQVLRVE